MKEQDKQKEQCEHRMIGRLIERVVYSDEETSDCCSVFSHLIIGGDDEDDAAFIFRIHGMILWI